MTEERHNRLDIANINKKDTEILLKFNKFNTFLLSLLKFKSYNKYQITHLNAYS